MRSNHPYRWRAGLAGLALLLFTGGAAVAQTATPTSTPTATNTPTSTPTSTPTPAATAVATAAPVSQGQSLASGGNALVRGILQIVDGGGLAIGSSGNVITSSVRSSGTLDIGNVTTATCLDTSIHLLGAAAGAECMVGAPAALEANISLTCFVSGPNWVKLRVCNPSAGDINPASGVYSVRVLNP